AASEPAPGSLSAKAATALPSPTRGSQRSFCSGVPWACTGWAPRPWRARAVSASVQAYARDSRIRHRSRAPEVNSRGSRPRTPSSATRARFTRPGSPFSASGRRRSAASVRSSAHQARCPGPSENAVIAGPLSPRGGLSPRAARSPGARRSRLSASRLSRTVDCRHQHDTLLLCEPTTPRGRIVMNTRATAHVDTFARDNLPPPEQWPELRFDLPELQYPERLNCAAELLTGQPGDRTVFRTPDGGSWTYDELRAHVDRLAHILTTDLGVVPGNRVLLRGPTTPWLAACWLAVLKAGAIAVTVLAQQRAHELSTICEIAGVRHALCDVRSVDDLAKAEIPGLRITTYGGDTPDDPSSE